MHLKWGLSGLTCVQVVTVAMARAKAMRPGKDDVCPTFFPIHFIYDLGILSRQCSRKLLLVDGIGIWNKPICSLWNRWSKPVWKQVTTCAYMNVIKHSWLIWYLKTCVSYVGSHRSQHLFWEDKHCPPYRTRKWSQAKEGGPTLETDVISNWSCYLQHCSGAHRCILRKALNGNIWMCLKSEWVTKIFKLVYLVSYNLFQIT